MTRPIAPTYSCYLLLAFLFFGRVQAAEQKITYDIVPGDEVVYFNTSNGAADDYVMKFTVTGSWADIDMSPSMEWSGSLAQYPAEISDCPDASVPNHEIYSFTGSTDPATSIQMFGDGWFGDVGECGGSGGSGGSPPRFWVMIGDGKDFGVRVVGNNYALVGARIELEGYSFYTGDDPGVGESEAGDWDEDLPANSELYDAASGGNALSTTSFENHTNVYAEATQGASYTFGAVPHAEPDSGKSGSETLKFHSLDLDIDGVEDEDEEDPGGYMGIGTDNLQRINVALEPDHMEATDLTLEVVDGDSIVRIWENADGTGSVISETETQKTWNPDTTVPTSMYVEALSTTTNTVVNLKLSYANSGENESGADQVTLNIIKVDLDVDSDNTDGLNANWTRTDHEDEIEDDSSKPGKYIIENNGDIDGDDVPNFADGFDKWDNSGSGAGGEFTPMILELPEPLDLSVLKVRFTYSMSDPNGVTRAGAGTEADPHVYTAASGHLRIWKVDGNVDRKKAGIDSSGGHFVKSGSEYTAEQLGEERVIPLYLEGINKSTTKGDQQIKVEVDPDGDGPLGWICLDAVRTTVIKVDLDFVVNLTTWPEVGGRNNAAVDNVYVLVKTEPQVTIDDLLSMEFPLRIHSSVTLPDGYLDLYVDSADAALTVTGGDIRILYKAPTLESLGVLPTPESDSVQEFVSCDNATAGGGSNHTDSDAFDAQMIAKNFVQRGKARDNGNYTTFESKANYDFMVHAGVQYVWFSMFGSKTEKRQIREQADWLYWSGHGSHSNGTLATLDAGLAGTDVQWSNDLEVAILAGCSVLDIKNYRAQSFGILTHAEWLLAGGDWSPGAQWESTGPQYLIGYCWKAPLDTAGTAGIINSFFAAYNGGSSIPSAWGTANNLAIGRNACVIDTSVSPHEYWYWDETSGTPIWTKITKGATGW